MGHLAAVHNITFRNPGLFTNVGETWYWSGTEYAPDTNRAWELTFYTGNQYYYFKSYDPETMKYISHHAWAVRDGDVACGAPEPPPPGSWQQSCDTDTAHWSGEKWCATCDWACWMGICLPWDSCVDVNQCPSGYLENNNGELQCSP
jgi:hypothetical protein